MAFFWKLLLAHFLADYPLQPYALVHRKSNPTAFLAHLLIQLGVMAIVLLPLSGVSVFVILGVAVCHGLLDQIKLRAAPRLGLSEPSYYFIDQFLHFISLALAAWILTLLSPAVSEIHLEPWAVQALAFVFSTYVWGITERVLAESNPAWMAEVQGQYWARLVLRAIPVLTFVALFYTDTPNGLLLGLILPYLGMRFWRRALLSDVLVSLAAILFLQLFA